MEKNSNRKKVRLDPSIREKLVLIACEIEACRKILKGEKS